MILITRPMGFLRTMQHLLVFYAITVYGLLKSEGTLMENSVIWLSNYLLLADPDVWSADMPLSVSP